MATVLEGRVERPTPYQGGAQCAPLARPPLTVIPAATRKDWRQSYGDLRSLVLAARDERRRGELENAYTAYRLVLNQWLRQRWLDHCGRPGSPTVEPTLLVKKLRSAGRLDAWIVKAIALSDNRPCPVGLTHVSVLAGLVESLVVEAFE